MYTQKKTPQKKDTRKKTLTFTKISIIDVHAKFALKWQILIGVNTLT